MAKNVWEISLIFSPLEQFPVWREHDFVIGHRGNKEIANRPQQLFLMQVSYFPLRIQRSLDKAEDDLTQIKYNTPIICISFLGNGHFEDHFYQFFLEQNLLSLVK